MKTARGQTLVLFALSMLLIALMVLMTVSIGVKAKDKLDLQAAADAAAYSNAIASARTLNTASLLNRAAVSEWVAMAGIQALTAWGSTTDAYMGALGEMAYDFQMPLPGNWCWMTGALGSAGNNSSCDSGWLQCQSGCPADCAARTNETRDAAYDFWHARYSLYSPGSDSVARRCVNGVCNGPAWPRNRFGQLDQQVADQQQSVWRAVHNLTQLEKNTYLELKQVLNQGTLSDQVLRAELGTAPGVASHAHREGWTEVSRNVNLNLSTSHDDAALQATMGSIDKLFPTYFTAPPPQVDTFIATIKADLNATHPGKFQFSRGNGTFNGCAFFTKESTLDSPDPMTGGLDLLDTYCTGQSGDALLGWKAAAAVATDTVTMSYKDGCTGAWRSAPDAKVKNRAQVGKVLSVIFSPNYRAAEAFHIGGNDEFFHQGGFVGGCHGNHGYWNVIDPKDHQLGNFVEGEDDIVPGGLAYVFPPTNAAPLGTQGQPKIPALFSRDYAAAGADPWDLTVDFQNSARFEIGGPTLANAPAMQGALANGVAYYHRRGYWVEPANLLNPYWRATLVPANADRPDGHDQTFQELWSAGFRQSAALYRGMQGLSFKGVQ